MRTQRGLATCPRAYKQDTWWKLKSLDVQPVLCSWIIEVALRWDPSEAGPKARIQMQVVYLGSHSRDHWLGGGKWDREQKEPIEQISTMDNWSVILLGNSGKQHRSCTSELSRLRDKKAGVFIQSVIGWQLLGRVVIPLSLPKLRENGLQWPENALISGIEVACSTVV